MTKRTTKTTGRQPKPVEPKEIRKSWTVWYGVGIITLSTLSYIQAQPIIASNPGYTCGVGAAMGAIVIALRFVTNRPIMPIIKVIQRKG